MSAKVSATREGEPSRVANLFCQDELQERETAPPTDAESAQTVVGTKVLWEIRPGKPIPGTIECENSDGTFAIKYDDGDRELRVRSNLIRKKDSGSGGPARPQGQRRPQRGGRTYR